ncbi:MAG: T9SS C-terminal target domain-containing protein, partial [Calditrichaeota bacterium]
PGASNILIKEIKLDVVDRDGNPLQAANVIAALKVTRESDNFMFAQKAGVPGDSEVVLNFIQDAVLAPKDPVVFVIWADIAQSIQQSAFQVKLDSKSNIVAIDEDSKQAVDIRLLDANGENSPIVSEKTVILQKELAKNFYNHPNPFGTPDKPVTFFKYSLDKDSDVLLRIYTLFGELVWEKRFSATDPQGRATSGLKSISWNGVNGAGMRVLNGIYLAVLTTNTGTVTTKVAVMR